MGEGGRGGGPWVGVAEVLLSKSTGGSGRGGSFGTISGLANRLLEAERRGGEEDHLALGPSCLESNMLLRVETWPVNFIAHGFIAVGLNFMVRDTFGVGLWPSPSFCDETLMVIRETFLIGELCLNVARQTRGRVLARFRVSSYGGEMT